MVGEVLSREEIESLLGAMTAGSPKAGETTKDTEPAHSPSQPAAPGTLSNPTLEHVTSYDLKQPDRVGKEQMQAMRSLHEELGRNLAVSLSALLHTIVDVKLTSVDQLTYSEFIFSLENPSCFNVLETTTLDGNLILDINPSILYPIIDRLLGGGNETAPIGRRPLTEIELRLTKRVTDIFLREMRLAWEGVVDLELSIKRVESNPQLVQILPPNEMVVLASFKTTIKDAHGMMNLCIPLNSIERIGNKLTSNSRKNDGQQESSSGSKSELAQQLDRTQVEVVVQLAETRLLMGDLLGLRVGDVITTEQDSRQALPVTIEGVQKFTARPGTYKGHLAFQVEEAISPEK